MLGFLAESFVFVYLGLAFFAYADYQWSWQFIILEFMIIIVGRFFGTVVMIQFLRLLGHKAKVTFRQSLFIAYAGLIRGAIAFGLVLTIDESIPFRGVIITTTLTLILVTTIVYGTTMALMQRLLVPPKVEEKHEYDSSDEGEEGNMNKSEYEEFKHPNLIMSEAPTSPQLLVTS